MRESRIEGGSSDRNGISLLTEMDLKIALAPLGRTAVLSTDRLRAQAPHWLIRMRSDRDLEPARRLLREHFRAAVVEPNYIYRSEEFDFPNDPGFGRCWASRNDGQTIEGQVGKVGADLGLVPVWKRGLRGSRQVIVAVIDTGIDGEHPDLAPNLYVNSGEIPNDGIDNDGNGYVDDVNGWNVVNSNSETRDERGHGTHCAGTMGAVGDNDIGIAGINWNVSLLPVKFMDSNGEGSLARAVEAIQYARVMKARVINASWGSKKSSEILRRTIEEAGRENILFVAAAGNSGHSNGLFPHYPSNYDLANLLAVAATDQNDELAEFSNYGSGKVQVAAPGVNIYSTYPQGRYEFLSGTSMAASQVSGIAALVLSVEPRLTARELRERLIRTSEPIASLQGRVMANGRVSAQNALSVRTSSLRAFSGKEEF